MQCSRKRGRGLVELFGCRLSAAVCGVMGECKSSVRSAGGADSLMKRGVTTRSGVMVLEEAVEAERGSSSSSVMVVSV